MVGIRCYVMFKYSIVSQSKCRTFKLLTSEKSSSSPYKEHFFYSPFVVSFESKANSFITLTLYNGLY